MPVEPGAPAASPLRFFGGRSALIATLWAATALTLLLPTSHVATEALMADLAERLGAPPRPRTPWLTFLLRELPVWYVWVLLLPGIVWLSGRFPLAGRRRLPHLLVHTGAALGSVMVVMSVIVAYQLALFPIGMPPGVGFPRMFLLGFTQHVASLSLVYIGIVAAHHAARYSHALEQRTLDAARLEARLAEARLDTLRTQIQPHFLFNTLNTVLSLMHTNVAAAEHTLLRLGNLLRRSLHTGEGHEVPLREELDFLDEYVAIQKTRFEERLTVCSEVAPETLDLLVPRLLLQPLVENALRHGLQPREQPGTVSVRARVEDGRLVLEVEDDGVGLPAQPLRPGAEGGIGLRNTRARLRQLYGAEQAFTLQPAPSGGVRVRVVIPARPAAAPAELVEADA